jgi:hypothetical protein
MKTLPAFLLACLSFASAAHADDAAVVANAPVVTFGTEQWEPTVDAPVVEGQPLGVFFAPGRLPQCRTTNRNTAWSITMYYRFDGGDIHILGVHGAGMADATHFLDVPVGSRHMELWFENYDLINNGVNGDADKPCRAWDSVFGGNYHLDVVPAL